MLLRHIDIVNFKNIPQGSLEFSPGLNCFTGLNGMGKSNMLEAIHFLCVARGMTTLSDSALIRHGSDALIVKGNFLLQDSQNHDVACGVTRGKGKTLKCDGKEYQRLSEHIGRFPIVTVSPSDSRIVEGAPEERRKVMDMVISQANPQYMSHLIRYAKALESRNSLLRSGMRDPLLYESIELALQQSAEAIYEARKAWTQIISPIFEEYSSQIASAAEKASIGYRSVLADMTLLQAFNESRAHDMEVGYTTRGIHRDDLEMKLNGRIIRRLGSQGQMKTFTIALRLAIFDYIKNTSGITPLLLLDDIFDRLDASRVENIIHLVSRPDSFGQIFITDTDRKHIDTIIRSINDSHSIWNVDNGIFTSL